MASQMHRLFSFLQQFLPLRVDLAPGRETFEDVVAEATAYQRIDVDVRIVAWEVIREASQRNGHQGPLATVRRRAMAVPRRDAVIGRMASRG